MKCKNWSNKLNNFFVRRLKSLKINSPQQQVISTMPAMPKEETSLVLLDNTFSELKLKEQLNSSTSMTNLTAKIRSGPDEILTGTTTISSICPKDTKCIDKENDTTTYRFNTRLDNKTLGTIQYCNNQINKTTSTEFINLAKSSSETIISTSQETDTMKSITNNGLTNKANTSLISGTGLKQATGGQPLKRTPNDYVFGKYIGEGSFSTVYLAKDIHTNKEYAIKVCDKQHIIRERKQEYIRREREVMHIMNKVPGFVNLSCSFQDRRSLYFVMTYAKNGDLLPYINKVGWLNLDCTRHYAAELVLALEQMHKRGVIHRDLKPENILLDENMHTLIADFGSAKILNTDKDIYVNSNIKIDSPDDYNDIEPVRRRRGSFVGTAQYVSPEVLQGELATKAVDLWALGCIIYHMISGLPAFRGASDYIIFKKIMTLNLIFSDGFDKNAEDLVRNLLKLNPMERLGSQDKNGRYESIRTHPFFDGINWDTIRLQTIPSIYSYIPAGNLNENENFHNNYRVPDNLEPGLDDRQLSRLLELELGTVSSIEMAKKTESKDNLNITDAEKQNRLEMQKNDKWNSFVDGELIIKKGFVNKRKGLFARKRMLLLTTGPRLIYIDPIQMVKKGEIPWTQELKVEPKNFKIFFVHTPNRTYYLEDPEGYALEWVDAIEDVLQKTYGSMS